MATVKHKGSRIFSPYRAIGYIANHVPLVLQVKGNDHFVTTAVGKTFHIYNCAKLNLLFVGTIQEESIETLASHGEFTVTSAKNFVKLWKRGKLVKEFNGHSTNVKFMLPFGEHIISIDESNIVHIWNVNNLDVYLTLPFASDSFDITTALHPNTYLNKILFASRQGKLQLWNIKTSTLIYEFSGWSQPILALEQAPAVDIAAIGLENGKIILHNLKYDETVMTFWQEFGPVTTISFRTDGLPVMATGSTAGHISLWDLEKKQIQSIMRDCHHGNISGMKFLLNQPLLISSGTDNALKLWIFDNSDGSGRLLKSRTGHSEPPTKIQYYGTTGHVLLSTGLDRSLRYISTIRDEQSCEMSQGSLLKKSKNLGVRIEELKLPPVINIDSESAHANDWDNIVTCHSGSPYARTWRLQNKSIGKHALGKGLDKISNRVATIAKITSCGNFVVVGYSTGHMEMFNIQSGLHRGSFITINKRAHTRSVKGIVTDSANLIVASGSADGFVKYWQFKSHKMQSYEKFECPVRQMSLQRESSLLAVSLEDFTIKIIDIDTQKIVRNFVGHQHSVTDIAFSPDARWLLTSSMDSTIRVWDLPSSRLIDCFLLDSPVTSLAISPTGDFLATTHLDDIGIFLWSNRTLYSDVFLSPLPKNYTPERVDLPTTVVLDDEKATAETNSVDKRDEPDEISMDYESPDQICGEIITLSMLPESRWKCLLDLKLIKLVANLGIHAHRDHPRMLLYGQFLEQDSLCFKGPDVFSNGFSAYLACNDEMFTERNKPKEPPKKPSSAPFFLPTIPGLQPKFVTSGTEKEQKTKMPKLDFFQEPTPFQMLLESCSETKNCRPAIEMLKEMNPSAIDVEFRSASQLGGGSLIIMQRYLEFFNICLQNGRDYELTQAYIGLFLKLHGKTIAADPSLRKLAENILRTQKSSWNRCQELMNQSICLINYVKSVAL